MVDFRGASAGAVAALTDQLKANGASEGLAGELYSVAGLLRNDPALRRFLADATVAGEAKTGLVAQVFGGKVSPATADLLKGIAEQRWTGAGDVAKAAERLSEIASVLGAGDHRALCDELFVIGRTVNGDAELRNALSEPNRSTADKAGLLSTVFASASPAAQELAKQSLSGSYGTVSKALEAYRRLAAEVNGEGIATVTVAAQLTTEHAARLETALAAIYKRPIHINTVVDSALLGGVKVEIGDDVIDGTIATRLENAGRLLAG
ncbi:ATP synthase subunit delta [Nocardioides baekrokdamisoli]|uniref:ATP synthase subunit delta n=1 Tax=Nocardioides baekrokdamisoli TaxID=1804624 RepID=A0A3G9IDB0_9ACTN|nr:F0F1 ATP synthase subunit delta [Nocardioides baekrokdamisoli]BBH16346.1 ATP synthase subunit delta [Nocardioides baekrokdamisoli]